MNTDPVATMLEAFQRGASIEELASAHGREWVEGVIRLALKAGKP